MKVLLMLPILIVTFFSASAVAQTVDVFACENCTQSQAQNIALQSATPLVTCRPPDNETVITIDNQQCFSQARNYYVFNRSSKQLYAFSVYHTNQGGGPLDLQLRVNSFTPTSAVTDAIRDTFGWYESRRAGLETLAERLSETFTHPTQQAPFRRSNASFMTQAAGATCEEHPSYRAIRDAFSPGFRGDIQLRLNEEYKTLNLQHYQHFQRVRLTGAGVQAQYRGIGVNASFEYADINPYLVYTYNWLTASMVDQDYRAPRVVFTMGIDEHGVWARLNERLTVIDGVDIETLRNPLSSTYGDNEVTPCTAEALSTIFDSTVETPPGAGSGGGGGGVPAPPGNPGGSPGGGWGGGGGSSDLCRKHYYINGERVLTVLVRCP